eukprot:TRINITY_DN5565_c0_g2_i4.p1 TRINITY_DN5565_c0_g2~~TRINITY_DN5565_c0_g2_i4.p1  ORF type:complete len:363 (-),score=53.11 TRINITY_DN5565_c0_g2_i4:801-1889(-)
MGKKKKKDSMCFFCGYGGEEGVSKTDVRVHIIRRHFSEEKKKWTKKERDEWKRDHELLWNWISKHGSIPFDKNRLESKQVKMNVFKILYYRAQKTDSKGPFTLPQKNKKNFSVTWVNPGVWPAMIQFREEGKTHSVVLWKEIGWEDVMHGAPKGLEECFMKEGLSIQTSDGERVRAVALHEILEHLEDWEAGIQSNIPQLVQQIDTEELTIIEIPPLEDHLTLRLRWKGRFKIVKLPLQASPNRQNLKIDPSKLCSGGRYKVIVPCDCGETTITLPDGPHPLSPSACQAPTVSKEEEFLISFYCKTHRYDMQAYLTVQPNIGQRSPPPTNKPTPKTANRLQRQRSPPPTNKPTPKTANRLQR